jgi:menaquinone-dependent protoporphyrinogen oxidase
MSRKAHRVDKRVLVVHAGRYGSTAEVAEVVAGELRRCGATVDSSPAREGIRLDAYDAIVVGSAIYWEHLLPEAARFIEQNREALGRKRVACFVLCMELTRVTEGPGLGVPVTIDPRLGAAPRVQGKLGYWERTHLLSAILGPVLDAAPEVRPVSVGVFRGRVDYRRLRFVHFVLMKSTWLLFRRAPEGDFRNWEAIRSWASSLCPTLLPEESS